MKYVAGEGFIAGDSHVKLSTVVYGNVTNSTGSIIPLMWDFINKGKTLQLYGADMTRFLLDIDEAVNIVFTSLKYKGCNIIPITKSFKIIDLFDIFHENFGLEYEVTQPRTGEKIHEIMASSEEIRRMEINESDNVYLLHPNKDLNMISFKNDEYSSRDVCLTKDELREYLEIKNYYK